MKTINIRGPIISSGEKWIYELFEEDATCPQDVISGLPEDNSEIHVIINSGGGYVDEGNEIYTTLKSYTGRVVIDVIKAGSAASVIAMAGDKVRISPVGQIMIHNASCGARGDYHTMDKTSEVLKKTNQSIASAYMLKTGLSEEELLKMMDSETWMTAQEAKEKGFADEILFQENQQPPLIANSEKLIPQNIINKMQTMRQQDSLNNTITKPANKEITIEKITALVKEEVEKALKNKETEQQKEKNGTAPMERFFFY